MKCRGVVILSTMQNICPSLLTAPPLRLTAPGMCYVTCATGDVAIRALSMKQLVSRFVLLCWWGVHEAVCVPLGHSCGNVTFRFATVTVTVTKVRV